MRYHRFATLLLGTAFSVSLTACSSAITTDESTWVTAITAGSRSFSSTSENTDDASITSPSSVSATTNSSATVSTTTTSTGSTRITTGFSATSASSTTSRALTSQSSATAPADVTGYGYCTASTLRVRPQPNTSCEPIGGLARGDKVTILGKTGDWYRIQFGTSEAYVSAQYISQTPPTNG